MVKGLSAWDWCCCDGDWLGPLLRELRKFWTRADGSWGLWLEKKELLAYLGSRELFTWILWIGACMEVGILGPF